MILGPDQEQNVIEILSALSTPVVLTIHSDHWYTPGSLAAQDLIDYTVSLMPGKISRELARSGAGSWGDPTLTIRNRDGQVFGVHFVGTPSGLEYRAFIDAIVASSRPYEIESTPWGQLLQEIHHPVHAKIFVSPT